MRSRNNIDSAVRAELFDDLIDQARIDYRLIALDVNNEREVSRMACDFCHSIGPATMPARGYGDLGAPVESSLRDSHVISSNDERIEFLCAPAALPHMV